MYESIEVGLRSDHEKKGAEWEAKALDGSADPLLGLLLTQVPNVQEISLQFPADMPKVSWPRKAVG